MGYGTRVTVKAYWPLVIPKRCLTWDFFYRYFNDLLIYNFFKAITGSCSLSTCTVNEKCLASYLQDFTCILSGTVITFQFVI